MQTITTTKGAYAITTERNKMDINAIHDFLANHAYWCKNIPIESVRKSIENSLNFGIFHNERQIGYARIISDFSTMAYLADVYVLPEFRGLGLSKWMMQLITTHPELQGLRRWLLATKDAHDLYKQSGFTPLANPERFMEKVTENIYGQLLSK